MAETTGAPFFGQARMPASAARFMPSSTQPQMSWVFSMMFAAGPSSKTPDRKFSPRGRLKYSRAAMAPQASNRPRMKRKMTPPVFMG